jgi:hypothetical protein
MELGSIYAYFLHRRAAIKFIVQCNIFVFHFHNIISARVDVMVGCGVWLAAMCRVKWERKLIISNSDTEKRAVRGPWSNSWVERGPKVTLGHAPAGCVVGRDFNLGESPSEKGGLCGWGEGTKWEISSLFFFFSFLFFFFFLGARGFELRASCLLGRCFYSLSHSGSPSLFLI